jgi:Tim10/DDP family zinc finger
MTSASDLLIKRPSNAKYEKFVKHSLKEDYYMLCIKRCISDFSSNLSGGEKVCLAKCIDRAADYFRIEEKNLNPFTERKESRHLFEMNQLFDAIEDGKNHARKRR